MHGRQVPPHKGRHDSKESQKQEQPLPAEMQGIQRNGQQTGCNAQNRTDVRSHPGYFDARGFDDVDNVHGRQVPSHHGRHDSEDSQKQQQTLASETQAGQQVSHQGGYNAQRRTDLRPHPGYLIAQSFNNVANVHGRQGRIESKGSHSKTAFTCRNAKLQRPVQRGGYTTQHGTCLRPRTGSSGVPKNISDVNASSARNNTRTNTCPKKNDAAIGVDFVTTSCRVATLNKGIQLFQNDEHEKRTPLYLAFKGDGSAKLGVLVKKHSEAWVNTTLSGVKHLLHVDLHNPSHYHSSSYCHEVRLLQESNKHSNNLLICTPPFLRRLKEIAERHRGIAVTTAFITVPAFFPSPNISLDKAAKAAGFAEFAFVQETMAAAIAYVFNNKIVCPQSLMVFSLGGGFLETAFCQQRNSVPLLGVLLPMRLIVVVKSLRNA